MHDEKVFRLAKPKKKGLLPLLFSRFLFVVLLLLLNICKIIIIHRWLNEYISGFSFITAVFTLFMVLYLFNCNMNATAKLTWMLIIALLPLSGAVFCVLHNPIYSMA